MKNNYKYKKENYNFWVNRLKKNENLVCTNDILLDRIEEDQIIDRINNNKTILELGCGNGLLLKRLIKNRKIKKYYGTDFVKELVDICIKKYKSKKINFQTLDMTLIDKNTFKTKYDYIVTKRAIQNVLDTKLQLKTIDDAGYFLKKNGKMYFLKNLLHNRQRLLWMIEINQRGKRSGRRSGI